MRVIIGLVGIILLVLLTDSANHYKKRSRERASYDRIVGGYLVPITHSPFVVGLVTLYEGLSDPFCGGTIIREDIVLTAAHCLYDKQTVHSLSLGKIVVRGGATNILGGSGYNHRIYGYKIHENFNKEEGHDDIAIIQTKDKLDNIFEKTIPYASKYYKYTPGRAYVFGWGLVEENPGNTFSELLKAAALTVLRTCKIPGVAKFDGWFCSKTILTKPHVFEGDSGGPVIRRNILIGIVSWGADDDSGTYRTSVYTKVGYHADWIAANIQNISSLDEAIPHHIAQ